VIDEILARYARSEPEIAVPMPDGAVWRFRNERRWAELERLREGGEEFARQTGEGAAAVAAFVVAELSIEPCLSHRDALRLATEAGSLFGFVVDALNAASLNQEAEERQAVAQAKKR